MKRILFAIFLLFFSLSCSSIYMINSDSNLEADIMSACWNSDGTAEYDLRHCENPQRILYERNRIPLIVSSSGFNLTINSAIDWINQQLDCNILLYAPGALHPDIRAHVAGTLPIDGNVAGITRHMRLTNGLIYADSSVAENRSHWTMDYSFKHELLHAVGLGHDDFQLSIMWSQPRTLFNYRITTHDRRVLREMYCE